ncbi:MAG: hypothetical protein JOZ36_10910 [Acidobacteria bacterium]|nr:hypothetical protein [Acidobacteriota bacterium]
MPSFIHDGNLRRFLVIAGGKLAPAEQRDLHRSKIIGADLIGFGVDELFATCAGAAIDGQVAGTAREKRDVGS